MEGSTRTTDPKQPPSRRKRSYAEDVNEAPKMTEEEPVDVEHNLPLDPEDNPSIEGIEPAVPSTPPVFEE